MAHYSYVTKEMLKPEKELMSVIDTFDNLGQILEHCQKAREGKHFSKKDSEFITVNSLFALNFYPFWQAHGGVMRPILLRAMAMEGDLVENFFIDAIPTALTIAMPNRQLEYEHMRKQVKHLFKEG